MSQSSGSLDTYVIRVLSILRLQKEDGGYENKGIVRPEDLHVCLLTRTEGGEGKVERSV